MIKISKMHKMDKYGFILNYHRILNKLVQLISALTLTFSSFLISYVIILAGTLGPLNLVWLNLYITSLNPILLYILLVIIIIASHQILYVFGSLLFFHQIKDPRSNTIIIFILSMFSVAVFTIFLFILMVYQQFDFNNIYSQVNREKSVTYPIRIGFYGTFFLFLLIIYSFIALYSPPKLQPSEFAINYDTFINGLTYSYNLGLPSNENMDLLFQRLKKQFKNSNDQDFSTEKDDLHNTKVERQQFGNLSSKLMIPLDLIIPSLVIIIIYLLCFVFLPSVEANFFVILFPLPLIYMLAHFVYFFPKLKREIDIWFIINRSDDKYIKEVATLIQTPKENLSKNLLKRLEKIEYKRKEGEEIAVSK
jgi:hypothetical protein